MGEEPNISHFKIFMCTVYIPIVQPQRSKIGACYVGYYSPLIIKYLELSARDLFKARSTDCHFNEYVFPILGGDNKHLKKRNELSLSYIDLSRLKNVT